MSPFDSKEMRQSLLPSVATLLFVIAYLLSGWLTLDEVTRRVPLMTGGVTLVLLLVDIARVIARGGAQSGSWVVEGGGVKVPESRGREFAAIGLVAAGVGAIYLLGFLIAIPLYLYASIAYLGGQSARLAAVITVLTSLIIYLVFEVALEYRLFPGVLFA